MKPDPVLDMETLDGSRSGVGPRGILPRPLLTVLGHPSARRVGATAWLDALASVDGSVEVHRTAPDFYDEDGTRQPLRIPFVSRKPLTLTRERGGIRVDPGALVGKVRVDGRKLSSPALVPMTSLARGVVLRLGSHVVLLLHSEKPREAPDDLGMVGRSEALDELRRDIQRVADSPGPVLIRGATGTGKERVAASLHQLGPNASGPWLTVNLAAVSPSLAASELFGHVKGAFSGADRDRDGLFVAADGGTLFLDEVGDTPDELQRALLRVLETGEVQPVGRTRSRRVAVRVVAATDRDLESAIESEHFRGPLYWRLAANEVRVPTLAERRADVGRLLVHFVGRELERLDRSALLEPPETERHPWLSASVVERLALHEWPGNVRELRNVARSLAGCSDQEIPLRVDQLERYLQSAPPAPAPPAEEAPALRPRDVTDHHLEQVMEEADYALGAAARQLGISRPSLNALVDEHPRLKRAKFLTDAELARGRTLAAERSEPLWRVLRVSQRGLARRMNRVDVADD